MAIVYWLAGGAVIVGLAIVLWRLTGPGKRLRFGEMSLFYTSAVTPDEARRVGELLVQQNFAMDVRFTRESATYQLQLMWSTGQPDDRQNIACEVLAASVSEDLLAGAAVEVHVCDGMFRPTSVVPHRRRFGRRLGMNAAHLFYLDGVTEEQAFTVATFLAGVGVFDDAPKIAQMNRTEDGFEFRLAVDVFPLTPELLEGERQMASDLSHRVFAGTPVTVRFCAGLLGTLCIQTDEQSAATPSGSGGPYRTRTYIVPGSNIPPKEDS